MKSLVTLLALAATSVARAEPNDKLPDFGTPADQALNKSREAQLGRGVMLQLRNAGVVVDDPQLTEYIGSLGGQIASHANNGDFKFHFFFVKENEINAFALPGGYVGVNSGLLLATNNENELAGVLAHEISHVTQRHIARAMYDNEHMSIVSMAAMLAAVLLGAAAHVGGERDDRRDRGHARPRRSSIRSTSRARTRLRPIGSAWTCSRLQASIRTEWRASSTRSRSATVRWKRMCRRSSRATRSRASASPRRASRARQLPPTKHADSVGYGLAKARLEVLSAPTPEAAFSLFKDRGDSENPADRYGLALAEMRLSLNDNAERTMRDLAMENPTVIAYRIGQAEALMAGGSTDEALKHYKDAERLFPRNIPLTISYAEALIAAGQASAAHALLLDLLNNVEATPEQLRLIARAANAEGDVGDAYYYMSYYYGLIGNLPLAISQVRLALETPGVHTVERERFKARLKELIDYLPPEERERAADRAP